MSRVLSLTLLILLAPPGFAQRVITTIAGADWLFPGDGKPALNAPLSGSLGLDLAVDRNGNYYILDVGNAMVMRVGSDGIINVIAGNGITFGSGDGGLAVNAGFGALSSVAVDASGNVYIAELDRIRKVSPAGIITTIAGTGDTGFAGDNGPALRAKFNSIYGMVLDGLGNLYLSDTYNNRIRKIASNGIITTVAGTGNPGTSGDGGSATAAGVNAPTRITLDSAGNIYFVETSLGETVTFPRVRKVDTKGVITSVAGGGLDSSDGILATNAGMFPLAIAVDPAGNLYIMDSFTQAVRKVDTRGIIRTIAGGTGNQGFSGDGGPALNAALAFQAFPALALDTAGNLFIADELNQRIRKIGADGNINTLAGNGRYRLSGDGGPATGAALDFPTGMTVDRSGNIFVVEQTSNRIRKITPGGTISVYAGNSRRAFSGDGGPATSASIAFPTYVTIAPDTFQPAPGAVVFSDGANCRIRYIDKNGNIQTFAGTDGCVFAGQGGPAGRAAFGSPYGLDFDSFGNLFIADQFEHRILAIIAPPDGRIVSIAGDGNPGFRGDNGPSPNSELNSPVGLRVYKDEVYFCDSKNHRVRKIDVNLNISTVAGNGTAGYAGDGGSATSASLNKPQGVSFDSAGNMYIADSGNSVIRMVNTSGVISTFAGSVTATRRGDGDLATNAGFAVLSDVFAASSGIVYVVDPIIDCVRAVLTTPPSFGVNPGSLAVTAPAGSAPADQNIALVGSIPGIPFTVTPSSSGWLKASPLTGTMPATIRVTVDPSAVGAGTSQGSLTITGANSQPRTATVPVTLAATAPGAPSLSATPNALTFSYTLQSPAATKTISVSNAGGGNLNFTAAAATTSGGSWLKVSPASGSLGAFAKSPVNITADPTNVGAGTYSGVVTLTSVSPAQTVTVAVTMTVSAIAQTIVIPQTGLTFFAVVGGGLPPPQYFNILNSGRGQMQFNVTSSTVSGGSWLTVFPRNAIVDASSPDVPQIRVDVDPTGLTTGIYYGTVQVAAPNADNTPQFVSVVLNVLAPGSRIGPIVQPTGLIFAGVANGDSPGSQTVTVQNTDNTPLTFTSASVTVDGARWLSSLPVSGDVSQAQPVHIVIQPQTSGLSTGVYRGTLTLSFSDGSTRTVAIVLVLAPPGTVLSHGNQAQSAATCQPTLLAPVFTLTSAGFSIPTGFPGQVAVKVADDCANPMTTGDVTVSFSNGDPPIRLVSLKDGNWAGTWTPVHAVSTVTVTADASITAQNLKGQVQIRGALQANNGAPVVGAGAVLNAASFALQAPLAPGSLISIFGSNLAQGQDQASTLPLPLTLAGSSVVFGGQAAPLMFASNGQVNAMVPFGLAVNTSQQVIVSTGSTISVPQVVTLAAAAPGIFLVNSGGQGIIVGDSGIADPGHPVKAGSAVVIYCTGLGEVNPPVPTGSPAPLTQLSRTVNQVNVTIGGLPANMLFAGLTPQFVGLYQVNAVVPAVQAGNQVPVVLTAAGQSSPAATIAVQ